MPLRAKISKEDIVNAGVTLVSLHGEGAINARAIAGRLGCSTQPIFSNFASMDELRGEIINAVGGMFAAQNARFMQSGEYPPYKASGMGYIDFARREPNLFRLLFMRDRRGENLPAQDATFEETVSQICAQTGLSRERAAMFHFEMWTFVHGAAVMVATAYMELSEQTVSEMLTDVYSGLVKRYREG